MNYDESRTNFSIPQHLQVSRNGQARIDAGEEMGKGEASLHQSKDDWYQSWIWRV